MNGSQSADVSRYACRERRARRAASARTIPGPDLLPPSQAGGTSCSHSSPVPQRSANEQRRASTRERVPIDGLSRAALGAERLLVTMGARSSLRVPPSPPAGDRPIREAARAVRLRFSASSSPGGRCDSSARASGRRGTALAADEQGRSRDAGQLKRSSELEEVGIRAPARAGGGSIPGRLRQFRASAGTSGARSRETLAAFRSGDRTPTFVIDGRLHRGAQPEPIVPATVIDRRAHARRALLVASGVPRDQL